MKRTLLSLLICLLPSLAANEFPAKNLSNGTSVAVIDKARKLQSIHVIGSNPPPWRVPLARCVGDCDSDNDCAKGLVCFQKDRFTAVPGCSGGETDSSYSDYCVRESDILSRVYVPQVPATEENNADVPRDGTKAFPKIQKIGNNIFDHLGSDKYPLGLCSGDCDSNSDCRGSLVCFERGRNQPVFGCSGGSRDSSQQDYCISKDSVLAPSDRPALPYTSRNFRLKLYWEQSYRWQEETRERKWCMVYNYRSQSCWHGLRRQRCAQDSIYITKCKDKEIRQQFAFDYLDGGDEILIRLGSGHNRCFQRRDNSIVLRRCDASSSLQRWYAPNGDFQGYRFEISQQNYNKQCVTTAHHPKEGEVVELHSCKQSRDRDHQSSYWNIH
ncbi:expressed unknown protein [Seminavis robusta]|uniref:Ricin B lectin domain-containing protein n=1 Tax=Seminavis robusta TaxID=568900 RepID=A0A9N8HEK5_9STRA|nr:expressed unknown protein [Seminavis robusta]|eukprot:Sro390_g132910.1 n/a (384) ;mRNA; f:51592-52919